MAAQQAMLDTDILYAPVITEKSLGLLAQNQYTFDVAPNATKTSIKKAIKELFDVQVIAVNTHRPPRKKRRFGRWQVYIARPKRAIVTLKKGDTISGFPQITN